MLWDCAQRERDGSCSARVAIVMRSRATCAGLLAAGMALGGCTAPQQGGLASATEELGLRYVALGDSYTIGTSVGEDERWPNRLAARVPGLSLVDNLGVNGYTSADLIRDELPALDALDPEFVTLLIGVNDVVQGVSEDEYAANVDVIMIDVLTRLAPERILCVATPDYTVTPSGAAFGDPAEQSAGIARNNEILGMACQARDVRFVPDIFEISREARTDRSLVADDGLHPSGAQYERWVEVIAPVVSELVGD